MATRRSVKLMVIVIALAVLILTVFALQPASAASASVEVTVTVGAAVKVVPPAPLPSNWISHAGTNYDRGSDSENLFTCFANVPYQVYIREKPYETNEQPRAPLYVRVNNGPWQSLGSNWILLLEGKRNTTNDGDSFEIEYRQKISNREWKRFRYSGVSEGVELEIRPD